jgi:hypothetical protein
MKLSFKKNAILVATFILTVAMIQSGKAQCKSVVKEGIKKLAPYTHNGQVNNVTLQAGHSAEIHLTFYKGLSYKLQINTEESLGKVIFRVLDENRVEVYNSNNAPKDDFWTFYSNSSQELIVELTPEDISKKGCAAVLIGMQVPKTNSIRNL